MRPKNLIVFLCVTWAVAFTSACCREKQIDSLFTNVKRWCFDSILQVRIHTGFQRFTEIGHTFHVKYIFKNKNTFQVEIWPISQLNDSETQERGLKPAVQFFLAFLSSRGHFHFADSASEPFCSIYRLARVSPICDITLLSSKQKR